MRSFPCRGVAAVAVVPVLLSTAFAGAVGAQSPAAPTPDASITGTVEFWNGYAADGTEIASMAPLADAR